MERDMTVGSPARILILFTIPMLLGNIFQQLYNVVDTIVVGNYVGASALAAVGASTSLVFLILCLAVGLSMGCSVLVGQYYGAGQYDKMRQAIYVSLLVVVITGVLMTILCITLAGPLLNLIKTPEEIFADAKLYFVIYSIGSTCTFVYNTLAALCRAIGDSKTPLYFLVVASVVNIVLDLFFVLKCDMGVAGVAYATIIAQFIASVSCAVFVYKKVDVLRIHKGDCVFDFGMFKDLILYAIPSTIQQSIVSFSQVAVQGLVNTFGTFTIAGYTAACKIDQFATQPLLSLGMAITSYTAQNIGAKKIDRIHKGYKVSLIMVVAMCAVIFVAVRIWGADLIGLFVDETTASEVIAVGVSYMEVVSIFYVLMGFMFCSQNILRGAGDMLWYTVGTLVNFVVRVAMAYVLAPSMGFVGLAYSIPMGWLIGGLCSFIRYKQGGWRYVSVVE